VHLTFKEVHLTFCSFLLIFGLFLLLFLDLGLFGLFELLIFAELFADYFALARRDFWLYVADDDFAVALAVQGGCEAA
jgi:hypothetical protein